MVGEGVAYALFNIRGPAEVAYRTENPYTRIYIGYVMSCHLTRTSENTQKNCVYMCVVRILIWNLNVFGQSICWFLWRASSGIVKSTIYPPGSGLGRVTSSFIKKRLNCVHKRRAHHTFTTRVGSSVTQLQRSLWQNNRFSLCHRSRFLC